MDEIQQVEAKRADAMLTITRTALGTGLAGTVPTPALELTKELGIALADAWMFYDLYRLYFDDESIGAEHLRDLLGTAGLIVLSSGMVSYAALKIGQGMLNELLNFVPVGGWIVSGLLSGSTTLTIGLAWLLFLEDSYRRRNELPRKITIGGGLVRLEVNEPEPVAVAEGAVDVPATTASRQAPATAAPVTATEAPDATITTAHPEGKPGATIPKANYDMIRGAIIDMLRARETVPFQEMVAVVEDHVTGLDKSARWYVTVVKLDLEAHGVIERVPDVSPQELRLIDAS